MKTENETGIEKFQNNETIQRLNTQVLNVIGSDAIAGFTKAYLIADAIGELKKLLTGDYMKPIMALQGSRLGFKTDKDKEGGYSEQVVKNCLIDAVLSGVQPFGNQFNIIAGNMYITKEGFQHLLNKQNVKYSIVFDLPRISTNGEKISGAVVAKLKWEWEGKPCEQTIDIPVKLDKYAGVDSVIGKATRKARAWLFNNLNGTDFGDGDASDAHVVSSTTGGVDLETLTLLYEMKREALTGDEQINAERIINNNEILSFGKLYKQLQNK